MQDNEEIFEILPNHPAFRDAISEIESLGITFSKIPEPGSIPYAVIGGRSNSRWWLIPLENRHVASSSLGLFQPVFSSAKLMKQVAIGLSHLGLCRLWAKPNIYLNGQSEVARFFNFEQLSFAYFTGTDSPHRKVTIQVMDIFGGIKGYAKISENTNVAKLLEYEANVMKKVKYLNLQTAEIPEVLFIGNIGKSKLLITDTIKTVATPTNTRFKHAHKAFLQELMQKTADQQSIVASDLAIKFRIRFEIMRENLDVNWQNRIEKSIKLLELKKEQKLFLSLTHGDFTPWNSFISNNKIYVFDWEYAEFSLSSNDLIHFVLNQPQIMSKSVEEKFIALLNMLSQEWCNFEKEIITTVLMVYFLTLTFRQIERRQPLASCTWDFADEGAKMFDMLISYEKAIVK